MVAMWEPSIFKLNVGWEDDTEIIRSQPEEGVWKSDVRTVHVQAGMVRDNNRETSHSTKERISTCSNKENCHINTPFKFCRYAYSPCLPSNTKALRIFQL